jgi:uncharacterized membrane protein YdfJ with MMPL/SSD domain
MFTSWGRFVATHRLLVLIVAVLTMVGAVAAMATVAPNLSSEGFVSEEAESSQVARALGEEFGQDGDPLVFLFDAPGPVNDPAIQADVEASLAGITADPRVAQVVTTWSSGNPGLVSTDGTATFALVYLVPSADLEGDELTAFVDGVEDAGLTNGLTVSTGGFPLVGAAIQEEVQSGIVRAETVSIPLTILIQVVVFGSLIAAGLPLIVGVLAIVAAMAGVFVLSQDVFQSVFAINIITMLGLGLGIDYSLFMVTRFREELEHRSVADAVAVTMGTVGKAIFASGITVVMGLAATQFFPLPALQSMGQAGMLVTAVAVLYGLTFLPALLALLGHRVNRFSIRRQPKAETASAEGGFWAGLAQVVMRNATVVVVALVVLLLAAGIPMLRLDLTPGGPDVLPEDQEPRIVSERLLTDFPQASGETLPLLVSATDGDPLSPGSLVALQTLAAEAAEVPGVSRVDSFITADVDWAAFDGDVAALPEPLATAIDATVRGDDVLLMLTVTGDAQAQEETVRDLRALSVPGVEQAVGGSAAASVDTVDGITSGIVPAAIFVMVGAYLILLLTFGSVFLPLKAMFMTLLSISASLGVVVWIFQDGNLQSLFGFQATGEIISTTPILMFCILFGLSMDYEVLMLSRIQEEYEKTGDNRQAVATGLAQTARVITGAALIMVVVFGGFMLADIVVIKSLGFGLALAVLIDATIVRGLLVPATMRLMGRWNWWAPQPVRKVVGRLGLSHLPAPQGAASGD